VGAHAVLKKPFDRMEALDTISRILATPVEKLDRERQVGASAE
jgi:FixJ family two-component response regulator